MAGNVVEIHLRPLSLRRHTATYVSRSGTHLLKSKRKLLRVYSPDVKYAFATVIFDFCPQLTVGLAKKAVKVLKEAIIMTDKIKKGIYSIAAISNRFSQIQEKEGFVKCFERAIDAIK